MRRFKIKSFLFRFLVGSALLLLAACQTSTYDAAANVEWDAQGDTASTNADLLQPLVPHVNRRRTGEWQRNLPIRKVDKWDGKWDKEKKKKKNKDDDDDDKKVKSSSKKGEYKGDSKGAKGGIKYFRRPRQPATSEPCTPLNNRQRDLLQERNARDLKSKKGRRDWKESWAKRKSDVEDKKREDSKKTEAYVVKNVSPVSPYSRISTFVDKT